MYRKAAWQRQHQLWHRQRHGVAASWHEKHRQQWHQRRQQQHLINISVMWQKRRGGSSIKHRRRSNMAAASYQKHVKHRHLVSAWRKLKWRQRKRSLAASRWQHQSMASIIKMASAWQRRHGGINQHQRNMRRNNNHHQWRSIGEKSEAAKKHLGISINQAKASEISLGQYQAAASAKSVSMAMYQRHTGGKSIGIMA